METIVQPENIERTSNGTGTGAALESLSGLSVSFSAGWASHAIQTSTARAIYALVSPEGVGGAWLDKYLFLDGDYDPLVDWKIPAGERAVRALEYYEAMKNYADRNLDPDVRRERNVWVTERAERLLRAVKDLAYFCALCAMVDYRGGPEGEGEGGGEKDVRKRALETLNSDSCRNIPEVLRLLCEFGLKDGDRNVRSAAAEALRGTRDQETLKWLCEVGLRDDDWRLRSAAAEALRDTRDQETLKWLREVGLRGERFEVREAAAWALER